MACCNRGIARLGLIDFKQTGFRGEVAFFYHICYFSTFWRNAFLTDGILRRGCIFWAKIFPTGEALELIYTIIASQYRWDIVCDFAIYFVVYLCISRMGFIVDRVACLFSAESRCLGEL